MTRLLITFAFATAITAALTFGPLLILTLLGVSPSQWAWLAVGWAWAVIWQWAWRESE